MQPKPAALVLGLRENGYGIVRSLVRQGVPVVGTYANREDFGRFSRHCQAYRFVPLEQESESARQLLMEWNPGFGGRAVLFPSSDYYANLVVQQREILAQRFLFHWIAEDTFSRIIDKAHMSQACQEAGVLAPRTHVTGLYEDLEESVKEFSFPCLIKPTRSFGIPFPRARKNVVAHSPRDLLDFYEAYPAAKGATVWQEIIAGDDDNIFQCTALIRKTGEVGGVCCVRKLRQNVPGYGSMSFGRSEMNTFLVCRALALLEFWRYRGLASLEFKYQPKDGKYYFIEMNPRVPWYNALLADAGVNLPYLAYLDLIESDDFPRSRSAQRDGVYWIAFTEDLASFMHARRRRPAAYVRWVASVARARSYAWWDWRDPWPCFRAVLHLVTLGLRRLMSGMRQPLIADGPARERGDVTS